MEIFASVIAVAIVFLFAVGKFSKQVQQLFGDRLKRTLAVATDTPLHGIVTGTFVTAVVQSSTAVSVLLVSLSSANIISLSGALAVIIGANIGTTFTLQLIAFKVLTIAPYLLVAGYILMHVKTRAQAYGKAVFYFGLIFSCLYVITAITESLQDSPLVISLFAHTTNIYIGILAGFVVSNILQSSSVTSSMVVIFASQGLLGLEQSLGLIYGANIGTTTTALLASLATDKDGKRVAVGHFLFNVVGVALFVPLTAPFISLLTYLSGDVAVQVAHAHLLMNIGGAVVFWLGFKYFERVVRWLVR